MDKKVYQAVHERSKGLCEICGSNGGGMVELHHAQGLDEDTIREKMGGRLY